MTLAACLFTLTALGGAAIASYPLRGLPRPPTWLALGHGLVAICSFAVLIYLAATAGIPAMAQIALFVFVLAALGGALLFIGFHARQKPLPIAFVIGHGLTALCGLVLLWISVYRSG